MSDMNDKCEMLILSLADILELFKSFDKPVSEFCLIVWCDEMQLSHLMGQASQRPFIAHSIQPDELPTALWRLGDLLDDERQNREKGRARPDVTTGEVVYDAETGRREVRLDESEE